MKAGRYRITDEASGTPFTALEWNDNIKPGMVLSIAMVLRKPHAGPEHRCLACDMGYVGETTRELQRVRWYADRCIVCFDRELTGE